jgi:glycosyltransferase involved in cell wall biosynthesis
MGTIDAFTKSFKDDSSTMLIIKTINSDAYPDDKAKLMKKVAPYPTIQTLNQTLNRDEYNGLIKSCDALVSLHRAEGFGLTMFEAISVGKPVIATDFSGNRDFMHVGNSFPVPFSMIEVFDSNPIYQSGNFWADPDISEASRLMKFVRNNYPQSKAIAEKGREEFNSKYSLQNVGTRMKERLLLIREQQWLGRTDSNLEKEIVLIQHDLAKANQQIAYLERTLYTKIRRKFKQIFHPNRS